MVVQSRRGYHGAYNIEISIILLNRDTKNRSAVDFSKESVNSENTVGIVDKGVIVFFQCVFRVICEEKFGEFIFVKQ